MVLDPNNNGTTDTTGSTATGGTSSTASGSATGSDTSGGATDSGTATASSSGSSSTSSSGGSYNGENNNGSETSSSVINAKMIDALLANPNAKSADIERVLAYIKDHPELVDNATIDELKKKQAATLGQSLERGPTLDNSTEAPGASNAPQRAPEPVEAKPSPVQELTPLEILEKVKGEAKQAAFAKGLNAFEIEEFGHGVRQNVAAGSTNQQLTTAANSQGGLSELAAIGEQLRGFLSGGMHVGNGNSGQLTLTKNQPAVQQDGLVAAR